MIVNSKIFKFASLAVLALTILIACKSDHNPSELVIHEIYAVEGDESTKKPTVLSYKDVKLYNNEGQLIQQNFYNVDNTPKGFEFIQKDGDVGVTNYYDVDSNLLAIYELKYIGNNITTRTAFDGQTKELLRSEAFEYDNNGVINEKRIYNADAQLMDVIKMQLDSKGNEKEIARYNASGQLLRLEKFSITKSDEHGQWIERWGYINEKPNSFHRRTFSE